MSFLPIVRYDVAYVRLFPTTSTRHSIDSHKGWTFGFGLFCFCQHAPHPAVFMTRRVGQTISPKMNLGALPSVLEGGAFDFAFSRCSRISQKPFNLPNNRSALNFDRSSFEFLVSSLYFLVSVFKFPSLFPTHRRQNSRWKWYPRP